MEQKLIAASVKAERWDPEKQNFEETESVLAALGFADWRTLPRVISIVGAGGKTSTMYDLAEELAAKGARVLIREVSFWQQENRQRGRTMRGSLLCRRTLERSV